MHKSDLDNVVFEPHIVVLNQGDVRNILQGLYRLVKSQDYLTRCNLCVVYWKRFRMDIYTSQDFAPLPSCAFGAKSRGSYESGLFGIDSVIYGILDEHTLYRIHLGKMSLEFHNSLMTK